MRESELDQEGIAQAIFECTNDFLCGYYGWDDVDGAKRAVYLRQAQWVINYGLDCRNAEQEKFLEKLDQR